MICPNCKNEVEDGLFCSECGAKLPAPETAPEPSPAPEAPPAPKAEAETPAIDKKAKKWPVVIPILLLAAVVTAVTAQALGLPDLIRTHFPISRLFIEITRGMGTSRGVMDWTFPVLSLFPFIGAVLFFLRTKKAAPVTAIPYVLFALYALYAAIIRIRYTLPLVIRPFTMGIPFRFSYVIDVLVALAVFIPILLALIYLLGTIVRMRFPLFAIAYLLGAVLMIVMMTTVDVRWAINFVGRVRYELLMLRDPDLLTFGRVFKGFMQLYGRDAFLRIFRWISAVVTHIACFIALLSCRKKKTAIGDA